MTYKLFLDDIRTMSDCITYMHSRIGKKNPIYLERDWVICRNYGCFVATIEQMGLPEFISFDHDLADIHYQETVEYGFSISEDTGYDCAKWLVNYCENRGLKIPDFAIHSMNVIGAKRISDLLNKAKWKLEHSKGS